MLLRLTLGPSFLPSLPPVSTYLESEGSESKLMGALMEYTEVILNALSDTYLSTDSYLATDIHCIVREEFIFEQFIP